MEESRILLYGELEDTSVSQFSDAELAYINEAGIQIKTAKALHLNNRMNNQSMANKIACSIADSTEMIDILKSLTIKKKISSNVAIFGYRSSSKRRANSRKVQ